MTYQFEKYDALAHDDANTAAILHMFRTILRVNKENKAFIHFGRVWLKAGHEDMETRFPWLSTRQIRHRLKKLEDKDVLKKGMFNEDAFDQTRWYTIDEEEFIVDPNNPHLNANKEMFFQI